MNSRPSLYERDALPAELLERVDSEPIEGFEPSTSCLPCRRIHQWLLDRRGCQGRARTRDRLLNRELLYQLSYPALCYEEPSARFERATVGLEVRCSIQLSYEGLVGAGGLEPPRFGLKVRCSAN